MNKVTNGRLKEKKPEIKNAIESYTKGELLLEDIIAPQEIELDFDFVRINGVYLRTLFVGGYPRFVTPGWLEPVINFDHSLDITFYIYPVEGKSVLDELRRKIAEMEAEIHTDLERGRIVDPGTEAKLEDARALQEQLVKGIERFYEFAFYITIPAGSLEELNQITRQVESTLGSLLVVAKRAALDMERGFLSTSPLGLDDLSITRNMDTTSLATTFPFTSAELSSDTGVLYGINSQNDSFIIFDRFSLENNNMTVFATSGAGKSTHHDETVLYDDGTGVKLGKIGPLIEKIISKQKIIKFDKETEGVVHPGIKVFTFNKNLKSEWAEVEIAAHKLSPKKLYRITTQSGRQITITGDHNLVTLKDGKLTITRGDRVRKGANIPLPRKVSIEKHKVKNKGRVYSREFLTLLGFITSEGHTRTQFVTISNSDPEVLAVVKSCIEGCGFRASAIKKKDKKIRGFYIRPAPYFVRLIKKVGAFGLSGTKRVPPFILSLSNQNVAYYLRAYFEGDGGVESHEITATTKSRNLASDISYLLLRFGIIARIKTKRKAATNTTTKKKRTYYHLSISGQDNIAKFINQIGFITKEKNQRAKILVKQGNTNVDLIPELESMFEDVYEVLYKSSEIPAPKKFSEIKLGIFRPSPIQLLMVIKQIEKRVDEIEALEKDGLSTLQNLPQIQDILEKSKNKHINRLLWKKLGGSWQTMKTGTVPYLHNTLQAASVTHGVNYSASAIGGAVYRSFKITGESLRMYDKSLWESVVLGKQNPQYDRLIRARDFIFQRYQEKKKRLEEVKQKLAFLKTLANSDLFWDPITKIQKIKSRHKYVYDLQVKNAVFLAGYAGLFVHNSFFVKLEALRSLMLGTEVIVIDPENEYKPLAEAVGGEFINFSFSSSSKINPFDLSQVYEEGENQLGLKVLSLHALFKVIMGDLTPSQEALLDQALMATYRAKGITMDPTTQAKEPPLMEDLYKTLIGMETKEALDLAARIEKYVKGSFVGLFDQHTNISIKNPFTVFSVRDLQDILRPIAMFIILDFIWTKVRRDIRKRLLVVDEAWHMMRYQDTAQFLWSIVKRARKYYLGLTTITQDVRDFLAMDIGKAVVTNSAMRLLLKQSPAAIDEVAETFYLSHGERQLLLAADIGEGILFAGPHHAPIKVVASDEEYKLVTSKPQEIYGEAQKKKEEIVLTPSETAQIVQ